MTLALLVADPFAGTLALLALVWLAAKAGGELALRLRLPAVAGELAAGLALAALHRGFPGFPDVASSPGAMVLANLGVILLMFAVGLESTVGQMLQVGLASLRVAVVGVLLPMGAGLLGAWLMLPAGTPFVVDLFIGACLCATSIGISVQVLREQGAATSDEGRVIVGAAVIDDVLGLLVLVAVSGLAVAGASGGPLPWGQLGRTLGLALVFLSVALTLGRVATPHLFRLASRLRSEQLLLPTGLAFAFLLAWAGNLAGLAPIVGAYAAGLILEPASVATLEERESHSLEALLHPLVMVLAPVFFVLMGAQVDVGSLFSPRILLFSGLLALLGTFGKYLSGFAGGGRLRASVLGWGMVPRGEVGLIFVAVGSQIQVGGRPLLAPEVQAAVVGALLLTTVAGPVGLAAVLGRRTEP
ncbi:MAG: cation:proton antiporter [Acidobacteria bacterium]|nr:cation:proton antiporter [Acidobacteriota bacterium]